MLEKIKLSLKIKSKLFDDDIKDLIDEAKADMNISGISNIKDDDPLIRQAIKTYCKAKFWADNKDSEKYQLSYELLRDHLSLCGEYNGNV